MARYVLEEVIDENSGDGALIWGRLKAYTKMRQSVELIRRKVGDKHVIEVRRWKGVRGDGIGSNRVDASPDEDY